MSARLADAPALARRREGLVADRDPARRVLAVCAGTGCRAQGALQVADALRAEVVARSAAEEIEVRATGCLGFCQASPLVMLLPDGIVYQHVGLDDAAEIVERTALGGVVDRLLCIDADGCLQHRTRDPLLPRSAASAAGRQQPARPDVDRRLHRARWVRGARPGAGDRARGRPRRGQALGPPRPRRRRLPHRAQVGGVPQGRGRPQVRGLQRGRGRPRRVHGRRPPRGQPAQRARGHDHRRVRDGRTRGPRVRAPGVPGRRGAHHARHRAGPRSRPARRRTSSAASTRSTCRSAAAAAPSSAARPAR